MKCPLRILIKTDHEAGDHLKKYLPIIGSLPLHDHFLDSIILGWEGYRAILILLRQVHNRCLNFYKNLYLCCLNIPEHDVNHLSFVIGAFHEGLPISDFTFSRLDHDFFSRTSNFTRWVFPRCLSITVSNEVDTFASRRYIIHIFPCKFLDCRKVSSDNGCYHIQNKKRLLLILNNISRWVLNI